MDRRSFIFVIALAVSLYFVNQWFAPDPITPPAQNAVQIQDAIPAPWNEKIGLDEQYYVLENAYQQLVVSTAGGALAELNLPISKTTEIHPIQVDRTLEKEHPEQDHFPAHPYSTNAGNFDKGKLGGYYPLIRRHVEDETRRSFIPQHFYALNVYSIVDQTPIPFKMVEHTKDRLVMRATESNRQITKTYTLPKDPKAAPFTFDLDIKVEGDARGLWMTSGIPEVELQSGRSSPFLKYRTYSAGKAKTENIKLPKKGKGPLIFNNTVPDWVCNSNGFFGLIMQPTSQAYPGFQAEYLPGEEVPTRLTAIDVQHHLYPASKFPGYAMSVPLPPAEGTSSYRVYAGPFKKSILKTVDKTFADTESGYSPDFNSSRSFHGWFSFISEPFAKFLYLVMNFFHMITRSWGISIILLTVVLRLMLFPLNAWQIKSTAKMQKVAPRVSALQKKYKSDPRQAQLQIMQLYKQEGINPASGCFPILIQLPFLIGMFDLLKSSFELRGASFIPGWINNLTAPDIAFSWSYPLPIIGNELHLLPILLGLVMFVQQRMSANSPKNANEMTDQQRQQRVMGNVMVIVFTVMFYSFPSGLNLYWLSSMLLGILQQWFMTKKYIGGPTKGPLQRHK